MKLIYSIQNKVIVITGATGYLGGVMVEHLSLAGAIVIVLSTDIKKAKVLCKKLNISENQAFEINIKNKTSIDLCFNKIIERFNKIDILVNNAYFGVSTNYNNYTKDDWYKSFDGTVISMDQIIQTVVPYMKENAGGRIINISSMYGMVSPNPEVYVNETSINPLSYGVGKAGMIQYTKYMAMSLAQDNILVNTISYGPFPNEALVKDKDFLKELSNKTFLKRVGKAEEVSSAVYFLSLDESSFVTGQNIVVDGGWTSW